MKAIEIKGLKKSFKGVYAVNGIDIEVEEGQLFALLGENGAGKTTTVKMLCGLTKKTEGEIKIFGLDAETEREKINAILNLSPQETAVANNLSVKENLEFISSLYGAGKEEAKNKAQTIIEELGLTEVKDRKAKKLSGGMQRRLSIAMAIITEPKLLFLDEPTLGLDVRARRELWSLIRALKGKTTVVLTTHYMEEAESLADYVAVMEKGLIKERGTVKELLDKTGTAKLEDAFMKIVEA